MQSRSSESFAWISLSLANQLMILISTWRPRKERKKHRLMFICISARNVRPMIDAVASYFSSLTFALFINWSNFSVRVHLRENVWHVLSGLVFFVVVCCLVFPTKTSNAKSLQHVWNAEKRSRIDEIEIN